MSHVQQQKTLATIPHRQQQLDVHGALVSKHVRTKNTKTTPEIVRSGTRTSSVASRMPQRIALKLVLMMRSRCLRVMMSSVRPEIPVAGVVVGGFVA